MIYLILLPNQFEFSSNLFKSSAVISMKHLCNFQNVLTYYSKCFRLIVFLDACLTIHSLSRLNSPQALPLNSTTAFKTFNYKSCHLLLQLGLFAVSWRSAKHTHTRGASNLKKQLNLKNVTLNKNLSKFIF